MEKVNGKSMNLIQENVKKLKEIQKIRREFFDITIIQDIFFFIYFLL